MTQINVQPTASCATFEELLPLLDTDALTANETMSTRQHLSRCLWCQAQYSSYQAFETALRSHYRADSTPSSLTLDDLVLANTKLESMEAYDEPLVDDWEASTLAPQPRPHHAAVKRNWRPRLFAEIAAVLVVALLATTLLVSRVGLSGGGLSLQSPLKTNAGAVVFAHTVTWGKLVIDGQPTRTATDGINPLYLPRGENTLSYSAAPFPEITCTISAPAAPTDTCPLYKGRTMESPDGTSFGGRIIDLNALPDNLSQAQRETLAHVLQHLLDEKTITVTVEPGDHYMAPDRHVLIANRTFPMTLSYHIDETRIGANYDCTPYCDYASEYWGIVPIAQWTYVDEQNTPEVVPIVPGSNPDQWQSLPVNLSQNGMWMISLENTTPPEVVICPDVATALSMVVRPESGWGVTCADTWVKHEGGFLLPITYGSDPSSSTGDIPGSVLYRAGVAIALDRAAQYLFPTLPTPNAHELAIARSLGYRG